MLGLPLVCCFFRRGKNHGKHPLRTPNPSRGVVVDPRACLSPKTEGFLGRIFPLRTGVPPPNGILRTLRFPMFLLTCPTPAFPDQVEGMGQRSRCGGPKPGEAGARSSVDRSRASGGGSQRRRKPLYSWPSGAPQAHVLTFLAPLGHLVCTYRLAGREPPASLIC
jgi:hypothetical protein